MKRYYSSPDIELIQLDNDISLVLDSTPPLGPGETYLQVEHRNDPFNTITA